MAKGEQGFSQSKEKRHFTTNPLSRNFYQRLGVSETATRSEIMTAYAELRRQYHPDFTQKEDKDKIMQHLGEALDALKNPKRRDEWEAKAVREGIIRDNPNREALRRKREHDELIRKAAAKEAREQERKAQEAEEAQAAKTAAQNGARMGDEKGVPPNGAGHASPEGESDTAMAAAMRRAREASSKRSKGMQDDMNEAGFGGNGKEKAEPPNEPPPKGEWEKAQETMADDSPGYMGGEYEEKREDTRAEMERDLAAAVRAMEEHMRREREEMGAQDQSPRGEWEAKKEPEGEPRPEAKAEQPKTEEPKAEEAKSEEPKSEEAKAEKTEGAQPSSDEKDFAATRAAAAGLKAERETMLKAEHAYLDERRKRRADSKAVAKLEAAYDAASATYESALEKRLTDRLASKESIQKTLRGRRVMEGVTRPRTEEQRDTYRKKFAERYRRMYVSKDIIDRGEARLTETLKNKERGATAKIFNEALRAAGRVDKALEKKLGRRGARAARILGSAVVGAGGASLFGAGVAAFGLGALGYRVARGATGAAVGSVVGGALGKGYERTFGAWRAGKLTEAREQAASGAEGVRAKRAAYRKGSKEAIEKKRRYVEAGSAFAAGGLTSLELSEYASVRGAAETINAIPEEAAPQAPVPEVPSTPETPITASEPAPVIAAESIQTSDAPAASEVQEQQLVEAQPQPGVVTEAPIETVVKPSTSVSISERGEGATKLFGRLQEGLRQQGYTPENVPPGSDLEYVLTHTPDQSSIKFGFLTKEGSRIMQFGDTFTLDPEGKFASTAVSEQFTPTPGAQTTPEVTPTTEAPVEATEETPPFSTEEEMRKGTYPSPTGIPAEEVTRDLNLQELERVRGESAEIAARATSPGVEAAVPPLQDGGVIEPPPATPLEGEMPKSNEIVPGYQNMRVNLAETHVYRDVHDQLVVFGGEEETQRTMMKEYLRRNPGRSVFMNVKGADGSAHRMPFQLSGDELIVSGQGVRELSFIERVLGVTGPGAEGAKPGDLKATVL